MQYQVHQTAIVDEGANIGNGTKIWHFSHVSGKAEIGENCVLGQNVFIGNRVKIGDNCKIQNNVSIYDNVFLGNNVFCGPSMVFTNVMNPRCEVVRKDEYRDTIVENGVTFGANCTIVCGIKVAKYTFVGAGSVVIRDTKSFALMVGNPARQIGWMSRYGEKIPLPISGYGLWTCPNFGDIYTLNGEILTCDRE